MFNVGGGEFLVILIVALVVLGPSKLPEVARQAGAMARELRRMSTSFQAEMKSALDEPVEEASRERGRHVVGSDEQPAPAAREVTSLTPPDNTSPDLASDRVDDTVSAGDPEQSSTAARAGMFDIGDSDPPNHDSHPLSAGEAAGLYDVPTNKGGANQSQGPDSSSA